MSTYVNLNLPGTRVWSGLMKECLDKNGRVIVYSACRLILRPMSKDETTKT